MDSGKFGALMNAGLVVGMIGGDYVFVVISVSCNKCELSCLVVGIAGRLSGDCHEVPVAQARFICDS